ncbi:hypothetical protein ACQ86N_30780 [Puia sp. P3]|uniref:hypothetical protein n=1 Tax=Puia sp. P3 TaxID=3423952 RepID=UPI003D6670FA
MKQPIFISVLFLSLITHAQRVQYTATFAPSTGHTHPSESPCRQSICLNGNWRFQPIPLPEKFKEGVDSTPILPPPANTWEKPRSASLHHGM